MSYQCKNCEREKDQNNNYVNATYSANVHATRGNRNASARITGSDSQRITRNSAAIANANNNESGTGGAVGTGSVGGGTAGTTQVTAKVMWGSVGAIKELREKEQAERNQVTRAGRRQ